MVRLCVAVLFLAILGRPGISAEAKKIVAIVEEVSNSASGIQAMDLLEEGQVIGLGRSTTLTVGYLHSCVRETITGGKVTIGQNRSEVENGVRRAEEVFCDGGTMIRPNKRGDEVAGAVFRKGAARLKTLPKPQWTSYGTKPIFRLSKPITRLVIGRLDKRGQEPVDLAVNGTRVDLSKLEVQLEPGGLYAISDGSRTYVLKISPLAVPKAPLLSRLVPM